MIQPSWNRLPGRRSRARRPGPEGWQERNRVDRLIVHANLEMQMRTGGVAGGTEETDQLPFVNGLADCGDQMVEMTIQRQDAVAVIDDDVVSVAGAPRICRNHDTIGGRGHRQVEGAGQIDTGVEVRISLEG